MQWTAERPEAENIGSQLTREDVVPPAVGYCYGRMKWKHLVLYNFRAQVIFLFSFVGLLVKYSDIYVQHFCYLKHKLLRTFPPVICEYNKTTPSSHQ